LRPEVPLTFEVSNISCHGFVQFVSSASLADKVSPEYFKVESYTRARFKSNIKRFTSAENTLHLLNICKETVIKFLTAVFTLNPKFDTEQQIGQDSSFSAPQDALYTTAGWRRICQKN